MPVTSRAKRRYVSAAARFSPASHFFATLAMNHEDRQPASSADWWSRFFDDDYAAYGLAHTPDDILQNTVEFLWTTLQLQPGSTVFDQCSGIGRLSLPLAARGANVIGVEQTKSYVAAA